MRCMNSKSHAVIYSKRQTIRSFTTADLVSDYTGASAVLVILPTAYWLAVTENTFLDPITLNQRYDEDRQSQQSDTNDCD